MKLDYFGSEEEVAGLDAQLAVVHGRERPALLITLAWYLRQRDTRRALALADEAQALQRRFPVDAAASRQAAARLALIRAEASWHFGAPEAALQMLDKAKREFESIGDWLGVGDACFGENLVREDRGDYDSRDVACTAASQAYGRAADPARQLLARVRAARNDVFRDAAAARAKWGAELEALGADVPVAVDAIAQQFWGIVHLRGGNWARAHHHFERCYASGLASGQVRLAIGAGRNAAICLSALRDHAAALAWGETILSLARPTGWPLPTGLALCCLANTLRELGKVEAPRDLLREAVGLLSPFPESQYWSIACNNLAELCEDLGDHEEALHLSGEVLHAGRRLQQGDVIHSALRIRAASLSRLGRLDEALRAAAECLAEAKERQSHPSQATAFLVFAEIARKHRLPAPEGSRAPNGAIHYMEAMLELEARTPGCVPGPACLSDLARDYEAVGNLECALQCERQAAAERERLHAQRAADLAAALQVRLETERAKAEAALHKAFAQTEARRADAEAAASRAKSAFLANMSHELRSPLNAMLGFSRLLLRDPSLSERARHDAGIVLNSGEHLYTLINQVLELSKIEAGRMTVQHVALDVARLLDELEQMHSLSARQKGLELHVQAQPDVPPHVRADAVKLRQVLVNLLDNAIKFTAQGRVALQVRFDGRQLAFEVSDTGVGIGEQELARLGEAFVQAEAGRAAEVGTGLGLAISRSFVRLMGGELKLASRPGEGTSVRFELPVQVLEETPATAPAQAARRIARLAEGCGRPRILAVDDRAESRQLLVRLLAPLGFEVREAANGQEAIEQWQQWSPQLVFMDMRMPVLDGREATRRIRAAEQGQRRTVIVALTASSFDEQREEILALGCDDFMRKPFKEEALLQALAHHLGLQYVYEEDAPPEAAPSLDARRLARLAPELRGRLAVALGRLDVQAIERAMQDVRAHDAEVGAALAPLVQRFEYERVAMLLSEGA